MIIFSHNDVQENNIMVKWADAAHTDILETKLIDFEYSSMNYRGADLAGYIVENMIDNTVAEEPFYGYHEERFPDFQTEDPSAPVNMMVRLYLQTYYERYSDAEKTKGRSREEKQAEFDKEFATMKEDVKKMTLHFHLIWTSWSILMIEDQINQLFEGD